MHQKKKMSSNYSALLRAFLLLSSLHFFTTILAADPPASLIMEQQMDAQQVLLIQTTNNGTATDVIQMECGLDTYYETTSLVLGVNRTVEPDATAIGAETTGTVMQACDVIGFKTYERKWNENEGEGALSSCEPDIYNDPGRKYEGWCGYIYLTPGADSNDPYVLIGGGFGFEEVDVSVCERERVQCEPASAEGGDGGGGGGSAGGSKDDAGADLVVDDMKSGVGISSPLDCSVMIALLVAAAI